MAASVAGAAPLGKGLDISLAALQRHDPYIGSILDVASQVALYTFGHRANEWEKTDVEGALFVYTRSASPKYGFTIMNRLSMENRTEPITKDLDFQLQDPFLLYRNAKLSIYGIWFYDKEECQRIAELMKNLTQQEQLKAQQGSVLGISPVSLSSGDRKDMDILQMLTRAKDEYTKCKTCSEPKQMISSSALYHNPNLIKPIPLKPRESQKAQHTDSEPQHLSLMTLFGKQEKTNLYQNVSETSQKLHQDHFPPRQGVLRSFLYEEPVRHSPTTEKQLCPAIQKLMVRGPELQPVSELPENRLCQNGSHPSVGEAFTGLFQPVTSQSIGSSHPAQNTACPSSLLQQLQGQSKQMTKVEANSIGLANSTAPAFNRTPAFSLAAQVNSAIQPPTMYFNGSLPGQALGKEQSKPPKQSHPLPGNHSGNSGIISPQELLKKLQIVQQEQQLHIASRPTLAAKFPVVTQASATLKPLDSWMDKASATEKQPSLLQTAPQLPKPSESGWLNQESTSGSSNLLLSLQNSEATIPKSSPLTKLQLQETLLHLIQNDDNFLNVIYDAYLGSVGKAALKKPI
ncbi:mRNA-decapping enzyme 1B isoform X2 [Thamnophis elegans]|uniref:mRNA-decapping enzyme 1B isoform X2 n=1 Tax=Thamnophis elegans TaxID=35005 RepID=UPI001377ED48|nr:mRNA-decapping enzyme 1B isoform X2 [Thamnophis elegans]